MNRSRRDSRIKLLLRKNTLVSWLGSVNSLFRFSPALKRHAVCSGPFETTTIVRIEPKKGLDGIVIGERTERLGKKKIIVKKWKKKIPSE